MRSRNAPQIVLPAPCLAALALCLGLGFTASAAAQSSGLKLGEESEEPTLDLGARPAEADTAPAPRPARPARDDAALDPPAPGTGGEPVRTTHGDWEVACAPDQGGCAMAQIGNDATGTPVLEMVIRRLSEPLEVNEQTAVAVLDVITPLGVVLTEGLSMTIDGGRTESAAFQICTEQGCLVREPVGEELIDRLKRGRVAKMAVFAANQGEVTSEISLTGFTKAYAASL